MTIVNCAIFSATVLYFPTTVVYYPKILNWNNIAPVVGKYSTVVYMQCTVWHLEGWCMNRPPLELARIVIKFHVLALFGSYFPGP